MKKTGIKSFLTVPLKRIQKSHFDSTQYQTAPNFEKIQISQWKLNQKRNYFDPLVSGPSCSNDEKNWGSKISLDCPFKQWKKRLRFLQMCQTFLGKILRFYQSEADDPCQLLVNECTTVHCTVYMGPVRYYAKRLHYCTMYNVYMEE